MIATAQTERKRPRILVVGDVMEDIDVHLRTTRAVGPEGVPVLEIDKSRRGAGGAGAVARMVQALLWDGQAFRGRARLLTRCLDNFAEEYLWRAGFQESDHVFWGHPKKERRFVDGRLVHRIDSETVEPISDADVDRLLQLHDKPPACPWHHEDTYDVILVADYGKGLVTRYLMQQLFARFPGVPVLVDPARGADWTMYRGAAAIVPNLNEWENDGRFAGFEGIRIQKCGPSGISIWNLPDPCVQCPERRFLHGQLVYEFPGRQINCIDVCGAGDQVLATLGVMLTEGHGWIGAARLANLAAALKCEKRGAVPVPRKELENAAQRLGISLAPGPAVATV